MAMTDLQAESACATPVSRRALMEAAPAAAVMAVPALAATEPTIPDDLEWQRAKAAYVSANRRVQDTSAPYNDAEAAVFEDNDSAPELSITYTDPGFVSGDVTLRPHSKTVDLTRQNYRQSHVVASVGDHPDYAVFCKAMDAWNSRPGRTALMQRMKDVEANWSEACCTLADVWHQTARFPVSNTAAIAEKIALLQPEGGSDGSWLEVLVTSVAADLARVNGRAA